MFTTQMACTVSVLHAQVEMAYTANFYEISAKALVDLRQQFIPCAVANTTKLMPYLIVNRIPCSVNPCFPSVCVFSLKTWRYTWLFGAIRGVLFAPDLILEIGGIIDNSIAIRVLKTPVPSEFAALSSEHFGLVGVHDSVADNDKDCPVILHISDLHFGKPMIKGGLQDRAKICNPYSPIDSVSPGPSFPNQAKLLKATIEMRGGNYSKTHKLNTLVEEAKKCGLGFDVSIIIAEIQCTPAIRYGQEQCSKTDAIQAHHAVFKLATAIIKGMKIGRWPREQEVSKIFLLVVHQVQKKEY